MVVSKCMKCFMVFNQLFTLLVYLQRYIFHMQVDYFEVTSAKELTNLRVNAWYVYLFYVIYGLTFIHVLVTCYYDNEKSKFRWFVGLHFVSVVVHINFAVYLLVHLEIDITSDITPVTANTIETIFLSAIIFITLMDLVLIPSHVMHIQKTQPAVVSPEDGRMVSPEYNPGFPLSNEIVRRTLPAANSAPSFHEVVGNQNLEMMSIESLLGPPPPYKP